MRKHFIKTAIVYLAISILCIVIDNVYAIFGHGVRSDYMSYMFLIPLLGGTIFFILLGIIVPKVKFSSRYRFFYNLYNSGIALLTVGSLYTGILEIAGTNSSFSMIFRISAMTFIFLALLVFVSIIITRFAKLQRHFS